jgi:hypothetical protein
MKSTHERRQALQGQRHIITFYGGWFVIDTRNPNRTVRVRGDMTRALEIAEHRNATEVQS